MTDKHMKFWMVALTMLGAFHANASLAQGTCPAGSSCVPITLNANVQYTNLHPAVKQLRLVCGAQKKPSGSIGALSNKVSVVNRGYVGALTVEIQVPKTVLLADPANRTLLVKCNVELIHENGSMGSPLASATVPQDLIDTNWRNVAATSSGEWSQAVTFPNVSAP